MEYKVQDKRDAKNFQENPTIGNKVNESGQPGPDDLFRTMTEHHLNYVPVRKNHSNRKRKGTAAKHLLRRCTPAQLEEIKTGDYITTSAGEKGLVSAIEVKTYRHERHYYFRLKQGKTLLYII